MDHRSVFWNQAFDELIELWSIFQPFRLKHEVFNYQLIVGLGVSLEDVKSKSEKKKGL